MTRSLIILGIFGFGVGFVLTKTGPGYRFLIRVVVDQANSALPGTISVGSVSSSGILGGALLRDVEFTDSLGRTFVAVDSLQARYSLLPLLAGQLVLGPARVWGGRVHIEKLSEEEGLNVWAAVGDRSPDYEGPAPPEIAGESRIRAIRLSGIEVYDSEVVIRLRAPDTGNPTIGRIVTTEEGRQVRQLVVSEVDAQIPSAVIRAPDQVGEAIQVGALRAYADVLSVPLEIEEFRGAVRRMDETVSVVSPRIWLTETEASGEATVDWSDPEVVQASVDLTADLFDTQDLQWLPFPLPPSSGAAHLVLERTLEGVSLELTDLDVNFERGGTTRGRLGFETAGEFTLRGVDLELQDVSTGILDTWIEDSPVPPARLTGPVRVSGPLRTLQVDATLDVDDPDDELGRTVGQVAGVIHAGDPLGFTGLTVEFDALDYGWLGRLDPRVPLRGIGSASITGSGTVGTGLTASGSVNYGFGETTPSSFVFAGTLAGWGPPGVVEADVELLPLSLDGVAAEFSGVPLQGTLNGPLRLEGPLEALAIRGDLRSDALDSGEPISVDLKLNASDPAAGYEATLSTSGLRLGSVVPSAPEDSRLIGRVAFAGSGLSAAELTGEGYLDLAATSLGRVDLDTAFVGVTIGDGLLRADTVIIGTSAGNAVGSGALGMGDSLSTGHGRIDLAISATSLAGFRPFFKGEEVVAQDTLTALQRDALVMAGVNPDTLPLLVDVEVDGYATGDLFLEGTVDDFDAGLSLAVIDGKYGTNLVDSAFVDLRMDGLPSTDGHLVGRIDASSLYIRRKTFRSGTLVLDFQNPRGVGEVRLERDQDEDYLARGAIELSDEAVSLFLDQLTFRFDEDQWNLGGPASFVLRGDSLEVRDLSLLRQGDGGMRMEARGVLTRSGPADFNFRATGLDLGRMVGLIQLEQDLAGVVDVEVSVTGTGAAPVLEGTLSGVGLQVETIRFDTLVAGMFGADDRIRLNLNAWTDGEPSLTVAADLPINLSPGQDRDFSEEPLDLQAAFTRYPAASVLGFVDSVEGVEGYLNGSVTFGGTLTNLRTGGTVILEDGALGLPALGVRYTEINASAEFGEDRTATVSGSLRSGGTATIQGTVQLDRPANPAFDLDIQADGLVAVRRRDLSGSLSGQARLTGRFQAPRVTGSIRVSDGELSLEEFVRSASVVNVNDPGLEFGEFLRDELTAIRPVVVQSQNPFLDNLSMDVTLAMEGGTWIRSRELDVEMSGELALLWDRQNNSLVLAGGLSALRGAYNNFGRRFQVVSGDVGFAGTPDLNPTLAIQTETRIRTTRGEPMNIQATVEGTLLEPRVSLSSDFRPPIAESDLVSYLLFGQPSYGLAEGSTVSAGFGFALGYLSSQIGSQLAQGIPFLDYVSVTARPEGREGAAAVTANDAVLDTSVEGGLYVFTDVFLGFRIPINTSPNQNRQPDAWVELTVFDPLRIEAFYQDRFARDNLSGLGNLSFSTDKMWGFLLYREWGF
jgi:translocation and assembly module TamB